MAGKRGCGACVLLLTLTHGLRLYAAIIFDNIALINTRTA